MQFPELERITLNPMIMGGKPCIRGMRITVGTIVGLVASGASFEKILQLYPYLASEDIRAVAYAAWRSEERDEPRLHAAKQRRETDQLHQKIVGSILHPFAGRNQIGPPGHQRDLPCESQLGKTGL